MKSNTSYDLTRERRTVKQIILVSAIFHICFTALLLGVGRSGLLPEMFSQDGLGTFASDSYRYMREVRQLVSVLQDDGVSAFIQHPYDFHVKTYALSAFVMSPVFGFTIIGVELANLVYFVSIVLLSYGLGREIFNRSVAVLAAFAVGLWPSFLLFSTQLYKTPIIVMLIMALVWLNIRMIEGKFQIGSALIHVFTVFLVLYILKLIRPEWWLFAIFMVLTGIIFSILQMIFRRRLNFWHLLITVLILVSIAGISLLIISDTSYDATINEFEKNVPTLDSESGKEETKNWWTIFLDWANSMARRLGVYRYSFRTYALHAGSNIDTDYVITNFRDFVRYLPRAAQIGFLAPFPSMWYVPGAKLGISARVLSGLETLLIYFVELMALLGIWRARKKLSAWYLFLVVSAGIVALGLVVPNVGALYRFRYSFWMLFIVLGAGGAHYVVVPGSQLFWSNLKGGVKKIIDSDIPTKTTVLLVANWDWVLYNFRLPLVKALEENGLNVILVCPPGKYTDEIKRQGYQWQAWKLDRRSLFPWKELLSIFELYRIYRDLRPAAVHHFTIKPIFYGSLAARLAKIEPVINNFTGLGYLFSDAPQAKTLRWLILPILQRALSVDGFHTAFQNQGDLSHLIDLGIISDQHTTMIPGTGIDIHRFTASEREKNSQDPPIVILVARLLWDKGLAEFVAAARQIRSAGIAARFWLIGDPDPGNLACVPDDVMDEWRHEAVVELLGHRADIPELLQQADIAVLPSYHEGVPLFLLEAAASGLPLVGSDIEGCRMVIHPGVNGYLVETKNSTELANAIQMLLLDPELRSDMGKESRRIAQQRFDQRLILDKYMQLYDNLNLLQSVKDSPVLFVANWDWVLYNFRLPLARALMDQGLDIILICPPGKYTQEIEDMGFHWQPWDLNRRSIYPWKELVAIIELYRIYKQWQPRAVHHFTIKPILYGSMAARSAHVSHVINNFTGLGYLFSEALKAKILRGIVLPVLRRALTQGAGFHTAFQNSQDRAHLISLGIVDEKETTLIPGTGVDMDQFTPLPSDLKRQGPPVVIMAARLMWDKGVAEYIAAARAIRNQGIEARFLLAGEPDYGNPDSVSDDVLAEWKRAGIVEILGHRSDMPALLQGADIAVLPSSYHEGVPLFLLEAAASGLALVGSDIEGCRMVIEDGVNGFLVSMENPEKLTEIIIELIKDRELRKKMGLASRQIAEKRFDRRIIMDRYMQMYREMRLLF
jgi:glycosyltransferase involved in cell wall biosynthesis